MKDDLSLLTTLNKFSLFSSSSLLVQKLFMVRTDFEGEEEKSRFSPYDSLVIMASERIS